MAIYRLQTSLRDNSGLPRDQYVSTLHVAALGGLTTVPELEQGLNAVAQFYKNISSRLSPCVSRTGHVGRAYRVVRPPDDAPPVATWPFEFTTAPAGGPFPNEVAICLSFHAARVVGVPPQSTRGRIYIGPLEDNTIQQNPLDGSNNVNPLIPGEWTAAAQTMNTALAAAGLVWVVYSRTKDVGYAVVNVSVDNEFDTVRSRGKRATTNTVLALTAGGGGPFPRT